MTDDNIKEVINRTSIVEIINSTVPLKKKGSNYFGLSPFKKEKTPSFSVNEEKKIFHCFSTGEHGNVIDFLRTFLHACFRKNIFWPPDNTF